MCVLVSLTLVHAAEHVSTIGPSTRPPGAMGQYTPSPDPDVAMPTHPMTAPRTKTRVVHVHVRGSAEWRRNPSFPTPSFTSGDSSSAPVAPAPRRIANQSRLLYRRFKRESKRRRRRRTRARFCVPRERASTSRGSARNGGPARSVWYDESRTVVFVSRDISRFMTQKKEGGSEKHAIFHSFARRGARTPRRTDGR